MKGIDLIVAERNKVLDSGKTVEYDRWENRKGQLSIAANTLSKKVISDSDRWTTPEGWDEELWKKMCGKSYKERLIIAGQLYLAESDRCSENVTVTAAALDRLEAEKREEKLGPNSVGTIIGLLEDYPRTMDVCTQEGNNIIHIVNTKDKVIISTEKPIGYCKKCGGYAYRELRNGSYAHCPTCGVSLRTIDVVPLTSGE